MDRYRFYTIYVRRKTKIGPYVSAGIASGLGTYISSDYTLYSPTAIRPKDYLQLTMTLTKTRYQPYQRTHFRYLFLDIYNTTRTNMRHW